jgi:hypothetical protein
MANPTPHDWKRRHPDVQDDWIERTLISPDYQEEDVDGRALYFGKVPEKGNWLKVVVENHQLHTAYLDRRLIKKWGKP